MSGPRLDIRDLCVDLGKRHVLQGLNLSITPGSFTAVLGPNGAGKSTLLRAAAGILPARAGTITRSRLAYLPQNGGIAWPMPVRDIVALGRTHFGGLRSLLSPADEAVIDEVLEGCSLTELADRPATDLSGGELSRVLLARVLAVKAPLLLLDEPVAALDPSRQIATMDLLTRERQQGHAVIAVLHDLTLALRYATRIVVMEAGRIVADDVPEAILDMRVLDRVFDIRIDVARTADGRKLAGFSHG